MFILKSMNDKNIPVLFITFARPEYARQSFDAIKKAKPKKFYFYSNKARIDNPDEITRNNQVRALINEIDWDCDLKIFFRDEFVDIYTSLWSAFDWIFENEEQAILLEEDCVPSLSFFDFCEQLLPKYKEDWRVWFISGNNFFDSYNPNGYDYIFSRMTFKYGWATWRSRWKKIERQNIPWEEMKRYKLNHQLFPVSKRKVEKMTKMQDKIYQSLSKYPAWDYTFYFSSIKEGAFGIIPSINLVSNIGHLGEHNKTKNELVHNKDILLSETFTIIKHPPFVVPDYKYDQYVFHIFHKRRSINNRIRRALSRFFKNKNLS